MKILIIGAGCVGLSVARELVNNPRSQKQEILVVDSYAIPSKGTSSRNSGVLHAGLYYQPNSLKARLCVTGALKLRDLCAKHNLPLMRAGKILVPNSPTDIIRMQRIYDNSQANKCDTSIIDYKEAEALQPGIVRRDSYLWSPNTSVFDPSSVLSHFVAYLRDHNVKFLQARISRIESHAGLAYLEGFELLRFDYIYNCAGPGALRLSQNESESFDNLAVLPVLGQYGIQSNGIRVHTNLYPVPDPDLPFLGVHLTPRIDGQILVGPNAIPCFQEDIQNYSSNDFIQLITRFSFHTALFFSNSQNYRAHALSEFSFRASRKFSAAGRMFFASQFKAGFKVRMDSSTYGIRPQLIDKKKLRLENDFLYLSQAKCFHLVNAVSPAFTSCLSLAEFIVSSACG
jgi:L-2-hydroxyglutarate oxidase